MQNLDYFKHPTAIVDDGANIGSGSKIWHFSHISAKALIGKDVSIGQNVYVANNVKIGNKCKIQNNVSVYDNVFIEDEVFCGPSMVFTNVYNPRSGIERKDEYLDTHIGRGATLGANCTIVCGNKIGKYSFVGAGAVVNSDVKDFALVVGVPAKQIGWMSKFGERLDISLKGNGRVICPHTSEVYILQDGILSIEDK
jgi:UDP-2-acetamido-3-amino-2,3-dideoxy-glucuronate N-acetyltransferase